MKLRTVIGVLCLSAGMSNVLAQDQLDNAIKQTVDNQKNNQRSQEKIDKLYEQDRNALMEYRAVQSEAEQLTVYNNQLRQIIQNQESDLLSLSKQINNIARTQEGIMPLMQRMIDGLAEFIALDIPFLKHEREQRISNLRTLLVSADVTVSEKFRRVLEAYQIELEYGRTIEAYRAVNENDITVDFLRLGRNALYQLDLNGANPKQWLVGEQKWKVLDSGFSRQIQKGIRIARQQAAPELLTLPLPELKGANNE
ncbi:DUF3450 domain-containing protein [Bermanella sp. R86510]|uniref:DUF3450 domain-containing protein n=1 Tax=unclassified Bermanella TaxID=2627862 RepID=UPI0037C67A4E